MTSAPFHRERPDGVGREETARWITGPSGRLRVRERLGGGRAIVLVHGLGNHLGVWDDVLPRLPADLHVVRLDLHGFGESEPSPTGDYRVEAAAADLWAVVDALALERVALVGHSYGGAVIGAASGMRPDRVDGALFVDPAVDTPHYEKVEAMRQGIEPENFERFVDAWYTMMLQNAEPGVRARVLDMLWATPRDVFASTTRGLIAYDPKPALRRFAGLKVSLVGPTNSVIPQSIHRRDVGVESVDMTGCSHWMMMDRPDEFVGHVEAFMARLGRSI